MSKVIYFIILMTVTSNAMADKTDFEFSAVLNYLDQQYGNKYFYGVDIKRRILSHVFIGAQMMFPSEITYLESYNNDILIKEHGGVIIALRSSSANNIVYQFALLGGFASTEIGESNGDSLGICECASTIIEPTLSLLSNLTPNISIEAMAGVVKVSNYSDYIHLAGIKIALQF